MNYRDPVMEVLLRLVIQQIDKIRTQPAWLKELREDWDIVSTQEFGFGTIPELAYLLDEERRNLVLNLTLKAFDHLKSFGDPILVDTLNSLGAGTSESEFTQDVDTKLFIECFEDFIQLLE